jgi:hypothetical protein
MGSLGIVWDVTTSAAADGIYGSRVASGHQKRRTRSDSLPLIV